jgi:hypothetical protein
MKTILNKRMGEFITNGSYIDMKYYEIPENLQARMTGMDYHYSIRTDDDMLFFITKDKMYQIPKKDFDWRMLWDKLENVPTDDNDEIEEEFEHFAIGSDTTEIWRWFEWFFDIVLGDELNL